MISVPIGYDNNEEPVGLRMTADFLGEPELIAAAFAVELEPGSYDIGDLDAYIEEMELLQQPLTATSVPLQYQPSLRTSPMASSIGCSRGPWISHSEWVGKFANRPLQRHLNSN